MIIKIALKSTALVQNADLNADIICECLNQWFLMCVFFFILNAYITYG